jgi:DNA-binding FadR family transcriptional regulator
VARAITEWAYDVRQPRLRDAIAAAIVDEVSLDQHRRILEAIERTDAAAAERAMREHLLYVADLVDTVEAHAPAPEAAEEHAG